ncbi:hypothetical protein [Nonlabens sp. YIK11]|uniref:hypothetical protein n=1 Tax=Nonlabens sp. YIK11 TaxID=1453349 RepID=UPI0012E2901C|nr:hypothetical protein [Nonlabens sp. YIK11]
MSFTNIENTSVNNETLLDGGSTCCTRSGSVGEPGTDGYYSFSYTSCVTGTGDTQTAACLQAQSNVDSAKRQLSVIMG